MKNKYSGMTSKFLLSALAIITLLFGNTATAHESTITNLLVGPVIGGFYNAVAPWAGVGIAVNLDYDGDAFVRDGPYGALNNWATVKIRVDRSGDQNTADVFGFNLDGASFTASNGVLQVGGATFATYTNSSKELVITFTSSGTIATTVLVGEVLRRINYRNDSPAGDAQLRVSLIDGGTTSVHGVTVTSNDIYVTDPIDKVVVDYTDGVSFSEAVAIANSQAGAQTLIFAANLAAKTITLVGDLAIEENLTINTDMAIDVIISGSKITINQGDVLTFSQNTGTITITSVLAGAGRLSKIGTSVMELKGSNRNTFNGDISIADEGHIYIKGNDNLGSGTIHLIAGKLQITSPATIDNAIILSTKGVIINNSPVTLTGLISGTGGFTKIGNGVLTLTNDNTYTGSTVVNDGKVLVNGALSKTSSVTIRNNGTLGGTGSVTNLIVGNSGTLSPGNSAGVFTVNGNLQMNSGSSLAIDINGAGAGTGYDQLIVNGTISMQGNLVVNHSYASNMGDNYTIIVNDMADAITGTFSGLAEGGTMTAGGNNTVLTASYIGSTGNDFTLTAPMNQPPSIGNLSGDVVSFIEDSPYVLLDEGNNATVTDGDSPDFNGGNLLVIKNNLVASEELIIKNVGPIALSGSNVTYNGTSIGTFIGGTLGLPLNVSFNAAATPTAVSNLLQAIAYRNTNAVDPTTVTRTIQVSINDGDGGTSAASSITVNVTSVNDAPTLTATGLNPTFTEGGSAVNLFSNAQSSTIEAGQHITELTLTVSGINDVNSEELLIDGTTIALINGNTAVTAFNAMNVTVSLIGPDATITLSKTAGISTSALNSIVNGIAYLNTSQNPTGTTRKVNITAIKDNSGTTNGGVDLSSLAITSTINVVAVNDAPIVTTSVGATTFIEGQGSMYVDLGIVVSDVNNTKLASATISISGNLNSTQDVLEFRNDLASMGNIASSYDAASGTMTLTSAGTAASLAQWQAALRAVTYSNSSKNPSTATRTITFKVSDGSSESAAASKKVSVTAVNDAPVARNDVYSANEDMNLNVATAAGVLVNDTDVDNNILTAVFVTGPNNGSLTLNEDGSFTYMPSANFNGTDSFTYKGSDGSLLSNIATVTITVNAINDAPVVTVPASITVTEDVVTPLTGISFSDVDAGTGLVTVTLSVPSGTGAMAATSGNGVTVVGTGTSSLTLNGQLSYINDFIASNTVKFTTASNMTNNVLMTVSINDKGNTGGTALTDTKTTTLLVTAVNDAPVNSVPGAQSVDQDASLVFSSTNGNTITVSDVDAGNGTVRVTLVATNGFIRLGNTTGVFFIVGSGINDASMTFDGTQANINAALNGLVFTPTPGYYGAASMQIVTDDLGNIGTGGNLNDTDDIAITVRAINPKVVSVGSYTANGTYKKGDEIFLNVLFDQNANVDISGGTPTILLETGVVDHLAMYVSGSGTKTLTFKYIVQAGDVSPHLDYASSAALALNGTTIKSISGLDAILTLPAVNGPNSIAGQHAIVIDGIVPTVIAVAVPADGYYVFDQNLDFTVSFSEAMTVNTTGGTPRLAIDVAGKTLYADYVSSSGSSALIFRYTVAAGQEDHDGIAIRLLAFNGGTIMDAAGNSANLTLSTLPNTSGVKVDSKAPEEPKGLVAAAGDTQVRLSWDANRESDLKEYSLYMLGLGGIVVRVADIPKGEETYLHEKLTNGVLYEYFLTASDTQGNGSSQVSTTAKPMGVQQITFAVLTDRTYGDADFLLTATAGSGLPVTYTTTDANIAEAYQDVSDGNKWKLKIKAAGTVGIKASQSGSSIYLPATDVNQVLNINRAALTGVTFVDGAFVYDGSAKSLAIGGSVLPSGAIVSYSGNEEVNAGLYTVKATIDGGNNYIGQVLTAKMTIAKAALTGITFSDGSFTYDGSAKSLAIAGSVLPTGAIVSYSGNEEVNAGLYTVKATIDGGNNYIGQVLTAKMTIAKAKQTIRFNAPATLGRDAGRVALDVESSSGLAVVLSVDDVSIARLDDLHLEVLHLGTVQVTAAQTGNENYEAAAPVKVTIRIAADASARLPILVHQAVSPNGDGINEFLMIEGIADFPDNKVTIFDKNGVVQTEIVGYNNRDKVFTGRDSRDGTYFYYLDLQDNGVWKREKGYFVIKR